jgi:transcriptional regulator with XRE-family HTH domain
MNAKSVTTFDAHVGNKLRHARLERKISQTKLGEHLGISFQQVQKYEQGCNRISNSRLHEIAEFFEVSVDYFQPGKRSNGASAPPISEIDRFMATTDGVKIANAMVRIADPVVRAKVVQAVEALSQAACAVKGRG